ncbi:MAG: glycosyltransferase family 2 protein [Weeksellaceae bacterium]|nr:glycosyltransferase family 2 protein [Weeksellaceae bacterium]
MRLSVVVVSYGALEHLKQCVNAVLAAMPADAELIVVDNATPDFVLQDWQREFENVQFVRNEENLGFSAANNIGAGLAKGEYLMLLNPDTLVPEDFFEKLLHFAAQTPDLGAAGTRMIDINGRYLPESKRNVPTLQNSWRKLAGMWQKSGNDYYNSGLGEHERGEVEVITGACMLMRRKDYLQVGGLDETYFMYGEDIDLCHTLRLAGLRNYYLGDVTMLHYKGESTVADAKYLSRFYGAMSIFVRKYYGTNWVYKNLLLTGIELKKNLHAAQWKFGAEKEKIQDNRKKVVLQYADFTHKQMIDYIDEHGSAKKILLKAKGMNEAVG